MPDSCPGREPLQHQAQGELLWPPQHSQPTKETLHTHGWCTHRHAGTLPPFHESVTLKGVPRFTSTSAHSINPRTHTPTHIHTQLGKCTQANTCMPAPSELSSRCSWTACLQNRVSVVSRGWHWSSGMVQCRRAQACPWCWWEAGPGWPDQLSQE